MKVTLLAIGSDIERLESAANELRLRTVELDIQVLRPLQTIREVAEAFANYNSVKPDIVLLDACIINDQGFRAVQSDTIEVLGANKFTGPIVAFSGYCPMNFCLMDMGATHRVDTESKHAEQKAVSIEELLRNTMKLILRRFLKPQPED